MAPFGFRKKNEDKEQSADKAHEAELLQATERLTIVQAQELLRKLESTMLTTVQHELEPIRNSATKKLLSLSGIAEAMEREQIKLEEADVRHKSVIENSRKAVVSTLKRESSLALLLPQSVNDIKKFRERLESMLSRFGEVSGSHSKLLNYFLKKHSGKMKHEFGELEALLKQTRSIISDFDQRRSPLVKCSNLLNSAAQISASSKFAENSIRTAESDLEVLEAQVAKTRHELEGITASPDYSLSLSAVEKIADAEKRQRAHRDRTAAQFSYISRVLAKYSYGLGKEATARVQTMSEEPWLVLENDLDPYLAILGELRKAVLEGKIQIKDSEKIINYINSVIESLPELKRVDSDLREEAKRAIGNEEKILAHRAKALEEILAKQEEKLAAGRQTIEQQKKQLAQRQEETKKLLAEAEQLLTTISGSRNSIET